MENIANGFEMPKACAWFRRSAVGEAESITAPDNTEMQMEIKSSPATSNSAKNILYNVTTIRFDISLRLRNELNLRKFKNYTPF